MLSPSSRSAWGTRWGESLTQKFEFILNEKVFFTEAFRSDDSNSLKEHDFELILQFYTDLIASKTSQPLGRGAAVPFGDVLPGPVYMTVKWVLGGMKDPPRKCPISWWRPCRQSWRGGVRKIETALEPRKGPVSPAAADRKW